jgi:hypothetical protein
MRTFEGKDGSTYLVFRTPKGAYHVFREVNARDAAREAFSQPNRTTVQMWNNVWSSM